MDDQDSASMESRMRMRLTLRETPDGKIVGRSDEMVAVLNELLKSSAEREGRGDLQGFSPDALELLTTYEWLGNMLALRNAIERAVLLAPGPYIRVQDLPTRLRGPDAEPISGVRTLPDEGIDLRAAVEEFESNLIRQALAKTGGNKNKAAQLLRLNRTTLVEMVKRKRLSVA
jgi:DNA-binding NtrC family response regulator